MATVTLLPITFFLLLGSGIGLPVCLPPGDPDPVLDKMAPDECLLFTCWSGWRAADPSSGNATERLLAEPEIHQLLSQVDQELRQWLLQVAESDRDAAVVARIMPPVVKVLLTRPLAMYVSQLELARNAPPQVRGAVVVNLGPLRGDIGDLLDQIPDDVETVTIAGAPFRRWRLDVDRAAPQVIFGIHGDYFFAAVGDGEVEALLKRQATPPPDWLVQLRQRYQSEVERTATVSYINLAGGLEALRPLTGGEGLQMLNQLGLGNLERFVSVAGLDKEGYVGLAALDLRGPPQGLVRALVGEPLQGSDLAVIPPDPYVALAVRLDVRRLFDETLEIASTINPEAADDLQGGIGSLEQMIGMRVREEFLQSLGDVWTLHTSPEDGGLLTGWTATVPVRDKGKVTLALALARTRLVAMTQGRGRRDTTKVVWNRFADEDIYHFSVADDDMPFAPAYCVTDSHLVVGLFPQAVKSFLLRRGDDKTLASDPKVAAQLTRKPGPLTLAYVDNKRLLQLAYPFVQIGLRMVNGDLARDGAPLDYFKLPSLTSMSRHLGAGVSITRQTDRGFEFERRQVLPSGSIGAAAPIGLALALPAVAEARRNVSTNNLRQIGIAAHNFHDTFKTFPPRYHTDRGGKPLLSWRVHLLPFLDQVQLYNEFRLDEPWDSEHNKRLIARMPAVYRSPVSKAPPGHTTYVVPAGKQSVFQPPGPTENGTRVPMSSRIADVIDGTSNTIMVVEVGDPQAVIWTKPADFEYSTDDPGKGLFGAYPGRVNALFTDGSVQFLSDDLSQEALNGLFTRDGREVVEFRRR